VTGNFGLYRPSDYERHISEKNEGEPWRDEFRRDYARVIHCPSFRRLQGKTQLFPGHESDFFRNRLTHSLEVAQIAESIAHKINATHPYFKSNNIDPRVCFTAAHLHDIGHPPFGHNGEQALDASMRNYGGFEGNAQTLRIISQLEKKRYVPGETCPIARRSGLNLTYRTLAAILKYDKKIPRNRDENSKVVKGYYFEDSPIVEDIKKNVEPAWNSEHGNFKTIECAIMDVADDIAYSTYDLEDSFKAGFLTPTDMLTADPSLLERVAKKVADETNDPEFDDASVMAIFLEMFEKFIEIFEYNGEVTGDQEKKSVRILESLEVVEQLKNLAIDGHIRTQFTSSLVGEFINNVEICFDKKFPQLSSIVIEKSCWQKIETLKNFSFEATIYSTRVKVSEYRGHAIVTSIFKALADEKGHLLLPDDYAILYKSAGNDIQSRNRIICDFIAGMTDKYAIEFYGRLNSDSPTTMFKPL
jgi:dGTPase